MMDSYHDNLDGIDTEEERTDALIRTLRMLSLSVKYYYCCTVSTLM